MRTFLEIVQVTACLNFVLVSLVYTLYLPEPWCTGVFLLLVSAYAMIGAGAALRTFYPKGIWTL